MAVHDPAPPVPLRRNALANMLGRFGSVILWIVVTPWVLERLGPERFGVWSLFFAFGGYVASLDFGMSSGMSRHVAVAAARRDRRCLVSVLRRSLLVSALLGGLWCVAFVGFRGAFLRAFHVPPIHGGEVETSLFVFAFSMLVFSFTQVLFGSLAGFHKLHLATVYMLLGLALHAIVLIGGIALGGGLVAAAAASVAGYLLTGLLSLHAVRAEVRRAPDERTAELISWRELLSFGGIVQASNAFAVGWLQAGKIMLGILGQLAHVTLFELGYRVANAVGSLPIMIQGAVIPAAASAAARGDTVEMADTYRWACRWIYATGGLLLAGLWLEAPALLTMWLGPGHGGSAGVARSLAFAYAMVLLAGPAMAVARGGGWPGLEAAQLGVAVALNVLIGLWTIPRFGPQGAALAMIVSFAVASAWPVLVVHRRLGISNWSWLVALAAPRFLAPAAAAALLAWTFAAWRADDRLGGLIVVAVQGTLFVALSTLLAWPSGDPRAVIARVSGRLTAARSAS